VQKRAAVRFRFVASTPTEARAELESFLSGHGCESEFVDHALICVSELIANAVQHGSPDDEGHMHVEWGLDEGRLIVSVRDAGEGTAIAAGLASVDDTSGRGLQIIDRLAATWRVDRTNGTCVSVELLIA
jgi:serine/threonine-protein kinase RsbW